MQDPLWYNVPENYKNATHSLLETHRTAIQGLATPELWDAQSASGLAMPAPAPGMEVALERIETTRATAPRTVHVHRTAVRTRMLRTVLMH